jgi:hypothetical protein
MIVTRAFRFAIAFGVAWCLQAGVSYAEMDWLDRLSGPGPFRGVFVDYRFLCVSNKADQTDFRALNTVSDTRDTSGAVLTWLTPIDRTALPWIWPRHLPPPVPAPGPLNATRLDEYRRKVAEVDCKSDQRIRGYLIATYRHDGSTENRIVPNNSKVRIDGWSLGYVYRMGGAFALSESFGLNRFYGPAFAPFYRASVTPLLEFFPLATASDAPFSHSLRFVMGATMFLKGFDTSDFCNRAGFACQRATPFHTSYELVPRFGIVIDPSLWRKNK